MTQTAGKWLTQGDGADHFARSAGKARETARSGTGRRSRENNRAGVDRSELGAQSKELKTLSKTLLPGTLA